MPLKENFAKIYDDIDDEVIPLEEWIAPLKIQETSQLSAKETEYYKNNTWDSSKTLEQNRRTLVNDFMKTCINPVEDFLSLDDGVILKLANQLGGIQLKSAGIEEIKTQDLYEIFYLLTNSPTFCQLMRALLTKYKTMTYRPQRAVLLFTKGEINHSSYTILHHVLNIRTLNQAILSALDCTKHKLLFGGSVFHEMLHWYHKISDLETFEKRSKSTSCICRRLREYNRYSEHFVRYFSNDEEYYTIFGIKEENGALAWDSLCEAAYTFEQYGYIRGSHVAFRRLSDERNFIINVRDVALLKFIQDYSSPKFGEGGFKCIDLNNSMEQI
jgi:hypothetical protein